MHRSCRERSTQYSLLGMLGRGCCSSYTAGNCIATDTPEHMHIRRSYSHTGTVAKMASKTASTWMGPRQNCRAHTSCSTSGANRVYFIGTFNGCCDVFLHYEPNTIATKIIVVVDSSYYPAALEVDSYSCADTILAPWSHDSRRYP